MIVENEEKGGGKIAHAGVVHLCIYFRLLSTVKSIIDRGLNPEAMDMIGSARSRRLYFISSLL